MRRFPRRPSSRATSISWRAWALLIVPFAVWAVLALSIVLADMSTNDVLTEVFTYVLIAVGALLLSVTSGIAFAARYLNDVDAARESFDDDDNGVDVDDPRTLIPSSHVAVWEELNAEYKDEDFSVWIISQANPDDTAGDILLRAAALHSVWNGTHPRYDSAVHEAAHAVVGMSLGQLPIWAAVRADDDGFVGATIFHDHFPRIDPIQDAWDDLRVSAAGFAAQHRGSDPYSGVHVDIKHMEQDALELVARGRRPPGYTGDETVQAYLRAAVEEDEQILIQHSKAVEAIAQALMTRDTLGGFELRKLFSENVAEPAPGPVPGTVDT